MVRFRGLHFHYYNRFDSYPSIFGTSIVNEIPTDSAEYDRWLQRMREMYSVLCQEAETYFCIEPETLKDLACGKFESRGRQPPSYIPEFKSRYNNVEWIYSIDLDREIFTVDHGAHFKLDRIPRDGKWIKALALGPDRQRTLSANLPEGSRTDLALTPDASSPELMLYFQKLKVTIIRPRRTAHFPPSQRHGQLFRLDIYQAFQKGQREILSYLLLSWRSSDLYFRETAFAILNIASGGSDLVLVPHHKLRHTRCGWSCRLQESDNTDDEPEFIAHLGLGCRFSGSPAGTSPELTMYWYNGVLVHVVSRLDHGKVAQISLAKLVRYGRERCKKTDFYGVLISVEHCILLKVYPDGTVDSSPLLPLFAIDIHHSFSSGEKKERGVKTAGDDEFLALVPENGETEYSLSWREGDKENTERNFVGNNASDKNKLRQSFRLEDIDRMNPSSNPDDNVEIPCFPRPNGKRNSKSSYSDGVELKISTSLKEGDEENQGSGVNSVERISYKDLPEQSFAALIHLFEAAARQNLCFSSTCNQGRLPVELYRGINRMIQDPTTHQSCMNVSRIFRDICQERPVIADGIILLPGDLFKNEKRNKSWIHAYTVQTLLGGQETIRAKIEGDPLKFYKFRAKASEGWKVLTGRQINCRSLLPKTVILRNKIRQESAVLI